MTTPSAAPVEAWLVATAVGGQIVFTLLWALAPLSVDGYDPVAESISALAAHGSPSPWLITVALVVQAVALAATAIVAGRARLRLVAVLIIGVAAASIVGAVFRDLCEPSNAAWCEQVPVSAHALSDQLALSDQIHALAANLGLALLALAPIVAFAAHAPQRAWDAVLGFAILASLVLVYFSLRGPEDWHDLRGATLRCTLVLTSCWAVSLAVRTATVSAARSESGRSS